MWFLNFEFECRFCTCVMCGFFRVDLEFPKIEVRFQNLAVEAFVHVGSRALPTIPNFIFNMTEVENVQQS